MFPSKNNPQRKFSNLSRRQLGHNLVKFVDNFSHHLHVTAQLFLHKSKNNKRLNKFYGNFMTFMESSALKVGCSAYKFENVFNITLALSVFCAEYYTNTTLNYC